jgi:hypothetical protein
MRNVKTLHINSEAQEITPMSTSEIYHPDPRPASRGVSGWLREAEAWLDDKGKWAWIGVMIVGFVVFWPIGLGLLAYMIWSKRMFSKSCNKSSRRDRSHDLYSNARAALRPSGNATFDAYKTETLRRLEDEQRAFEEFLARLRDAKDKAEFDAFMDDRAGRARNGNGNGDSTGDHPAAA